MKKILLVSFHTLNHTAFRILLEIAQNHKLQNDELYLFSCKDALPYCICNKEHSEKKCFYCHSRLYEAQKVLSIPSQNVFHVQNHPPAPFSFSSMQELQNITIDDINVGIGITKTVIAEFMDHKFCVKTHKKLIEKMIHTANSVHQSFTSLLQKEQFNLVHIFNGRDVTEYPIINICKHHKIPFYSHEQKAKKRYFLFKDAEVHKLALHKEHIESWTQKHSPKEIKKIGSEWFQRKKNKTADEVIFTKNQKRNKLPALFDYSKHNIAFFSTSRMEVECLKDWQMPFYKNENDALLQICTDLAQFPNYHFYIRNHPHMKHINNTQRKEFVALQEKNFKNVTVIWPEDKVDSYALLEACEKSICSSSTICAEACYWEKPSILLGRSTYESCKCSYIPKNHTEVMELITTPLSPLKKTDVYKFGFYQATGGNVFKHFLGPDSARKGVFLESIPLSFRYKKTDLLKLYALRAYEKLKYKNFLPFLKHKAEKQK